MAREIQLELEDAQGERASMSFVIASDAQADTEALITSVAEMTRAKIISARASRAIELVTITNNDAVAANNESARLKAVIKMQGIDLGSPFRNTADVTMSIPAPVGTIIPYAGTNAEIANIVSKVFSDSGVQMSRVTSVKYGGRR